MNEIDIQYYSIWIRLIMIKGYNGNVYWNNFYRILVVFLLNKFVLFFGKSISMFLSTTILINEILYEGTKWLLQSHLTRQSSNCRIKFLLMFSPQKKNVLIQQSTLIAWLKNRKTIALNVRSHRHEWVKPIDWKKRLAFTHLQLFFCKRLARS